MSRLIRQCGVWAIVLSAATAVATEGNPDAGIPFDEAANLSARAAAAFAQKDFAEAERLWREVIQKHPTSSQLGVAQYNVGYVLQERGKYDAAIAEYQKLLASKVNDKEPGSNIMEAYRNYRNKAAKQISRCYETQGLNRQALDWAIQARDKYPYLTWCGTCAMQEKEATDSNITRLQRLVDAPPKR